MNQFKRTLLFWAALVGPGLCVGQASTPQSLSIYQSKSAWQTQEGTQVTLSSLKGAPVVMTLLYTSCQASCPVVMSDLRAIEKGLSAAAKQKVRFAVFSFDSEKDQPKHLKIFAQKHGVDLTHWTFFHGSPQSVRELAALLGVQFKQLDTSEFDHSNVISILDANGTIVYQQTGLRKKPDESIKALEKLSLLQ